MRSINDLSAAYKADHVIPDGITKAIAVIKEISTLTSKMLGLPTGNHPTVMSYRGGWHTAVFLPEFVQEGIDSLKNFKKTQGHNHG